MKRRKVVKLYKSKKPVLGRFGWIGRHLFGPLMLVQFEKGDCCLIPCPLLRAPTFRNEKGKTNHVFLESTALKRSPKQSFFQGVAHQLKVNWWFGAVGLGFNRRAPFSVISIRKGIPGIQTPRPQTANWPFVESMRLLKIAINFNPQFNIQPSN